jgi:predicted homoserine dehydrogenase-like protein
VAEVLAVAKRDLKAGERLDGIGGYCTYGLIENATVARKIGALPIGLSDGCVLRQDVAKDEVILSAQVHAVEDPVIDGLWREQNERWPVVNSEVKALSGSEG